MKKISYKRIILFVFLALFFLANLLLCFKNLRLNEVVSKKISENVLMEKKISYYNSTFNQMLEIDTANHQKGFKIGVYLNLNSCDDCNKKTLIFIRSKFKSKDICLYVDSVGNDPYLSSLQSVGIKLKYVKKDNSFFRSINPFFFLTKNEDKFFKFSHDNDHEDLTNLYFNTIKAYL